eukprot:COSAG02_NODE_990_length_15413_cov_24.707457_11_plen_202_part_00
MGLSWRYGFQDPDANTVPPDPEGQHCTGSFNANGGSPYCHFGREWECFVSGREPAAGGAALGNAPGAITTAACQAACAAKPGCEWWVLRNSTSSSSTSSSIMATTTCELIGKGSDGTQACTGSAICEMGPRACPGMSDAPVQSDEGDEAGRHVTMTDATVAALVDPRTVDPPATGAYDLGDETPLAAIARLDDAGYFNSGM